MSPSGHNHDMQIGSTLQDARRRLGLDVREVEERTKIRARYIRALENEDWESLPAPAYVRGFLRTYGQLLGLDGEMLADEFRRHSRSADTAPAGPVPGDPVLSDTGRRGRAAPSRGAWVGILAIALVGILLAIGLLGGDGEDEPAETEPRTAQERREARQERQALRRERERRQERREERRQAAANRQVSLDLRMISPVELCVIEGADTVLIDRQVLLEGAEESFPEARRFRIDLIGGGEVRIDTGRDTQRVASDEPVTVEADGRGIRTADFRGPGCP